MCSTCDCVSQCLYKYFTLWTHELNLYVPIFAYDFILYVNYTLYIMNITTYRPVHVELKVNRVAL